MKELTLPQVNHLLGRRLFVFFDEWLTYYLLYKFYKSKDYKMLFLISFLGLFGNGWGYYSLFKLRKSYKIED